MVTRVTLLWGITLRVTILIGPALVYIAPAMPLLMLEAGHPVSKANRLPEVLQEAVDAISSQSAFQLAKERHATLTHWLNRAKALSSAELVLHSELPEALGRILAPKRLLLWKVNACSLWLP